LNAAQFTPADFWDRLEGKARAIGFGAIGVAQISELAEEGKALEEWLSAGFAGEMEYLERSKEVRKDPELFLPAAKSVLIVTVNYYKKYSANTSATGKIARYAVGRDYHNVLQKMLQQLQACVQREFFPEATAADFRIALDAHPVLERTWAERAGLGIRGKNSCLITEQHGSWVLLGAIVTTLELPAKPLTPRAEHFAKLSCGKCTRCIDACPTGAIIAPGQIDARKCIAYLTIESKSGIPLELRAKVGDRLFGCDICQEVCPFNLPRQKEEQNPLMERQIAGTQLLLKEILEIPTDADFERRFAGSPVMRAKRRGMIRNACVVAGNSQDSELLPVLQEVFRREEDPMLKEHAAWAMEAITAAKS